MYINISNSNDLEENQTNGPNILIYNPWNFNMSVIPLLRSGNGNFVMVNDQQNGAQGYLTFYFFVYNPTTASGSADITINLYDHLPENGNNSIPIIQFTFASGTIAANSGVWITVTPNIYWQYNSLIVMPYPDCISSQSGNIGIAMPDSSNNFDSHFWNGTNWDTEDDGFIGFWSITNAAPSSLPVSVVSPVKISTGTPQNVLTSLTSGTIATVPNGKKWKILRAYASVICSGTSPCQLGIVIAPLNNENYNFYENLLYINQTSPGADAEYFGCGDILNTNSSQTAVESEYWHQYPELYAGDGLILTSVNIISQKAQIWYVESDI